MEITEIEDLMASSSFDPLIVDAINIILCSANDWPRRVKSMEGYELEVRQFLGADVTRNNIEHGLKKIDFSTSSWEAESLSQLVEIFDIFPGKPSFGIIVEYLSDVLSLKASQ